MYITEIQYIKEVCLWLSPSASFGDKKLERKAKQMTRESLNVSALHSKAKQQSIGVEF